MHDDLWWHARKRVTWEQLLIASKLEHRTRSSGVIVLRCVFHSERGGSLHLWPGGGFFCHGCRTRGTRLDFIALHWDLETPEQLAEFIDRLPPHPNPAQLEFSFMEDHG